MVVIWCKLKITLKECAGAITLTRSSCYQGIGDRGLGVSTYALRLPVLQTAKLDYLH